MCSDVLVGFLIGVLLVVTYFMFRYRAHYLSIERDFDCLHNLLAGSEAEVSNLIDENMELQRLNQLYELKAKVRQADLKHRLGER